MPKKVTVLFTKISIRDGLSKDLFLKTYGKSFIQANSLNRMRLKQTCNNCNRVTVIDYNRL